MRSTLTYGSVRGAAREGRSYRDRGRSHFEEIGRLPWCATCEAAVALIVSLITRTASLRTITKILFFIHDHFERLAVEQTSGLLGDPIKLT